MGQKEWDKNYAIYLDSIFQLFKDMTSISILKRDMLKALQKIPK